MAGFKGSRCQFFDGTVALGVVSLAALLRCFTVRDLVRTIFGVLRPSKFPSAPTLITVYPII